MGAAPQPYAACHCTSRAELYLLQRHIFPKASEGHWIPVWDENGLPFFVFFKFYRITCPIQIPYNNEHIQGIRQIAGRRWESEAKRWIIPYTIATIQKFTNLFDSVHVQISPELREESEALRDWKISGEPPKWKRDQLQQALKLRGYSRKTIKAYCSQIERFLASLPQVDTDISTSNVQTYCYLNP
ncbi:hypothetical protein QVE09_28470 [Paenibacillus sp. ClWae2A]|uniref:phage integrase N-terminal SAM-like domain-containing protein n=1 Tax=Paenibacillus sp. ClWae2A TaxID=3057177 RepID=UPI0028F58CCE|nr:phage integrase N-terminal SAM-like domain-containing protein [Paenibacillus sp. ClWae2A]MDT9722834.1 hypothetical protein [Paenibacillus sp. ClWae2A]